MSTFDSPFATLWADFSNYSQRLATISEESKSLADNLEHLISEGYVILENAVSHAAIDKYLEEFYADLNKGKEFHISHGERYLKSSDMALNTPLLKILDNHYLYPSAANISLSPAISKFLEAYFLELPLAFQSLHFEVGSTQSLHQDTAYVVVNESLNLLASWVALEDISPGSGELMFVPRSHRLPDFMYNQHFKHWNASRDGHAIHDHHLWWINNAVEEYGLQIKTFVPKKGDVLIWHADLMHGGSQITDASLSRRSLVTHYCGMSRTPHYFNDLPPVRQKKNKHKNGYVSSYFYAK